MNALSIRDFDDKRFLNLLPYPFPTREAKAVVTHYIHTMKTAFAKHFMDDARFALSEYLNYINSLHDIHLSHTDAIQQLSLELNNVPFPSNVGFSFTFIDLFAGIGGFRLALQNLGGKCVFSSEWDEQAKKTYVANFGDVPFGDITKEDTKKFIPDGFDVLCAGFPCQAFSIAGKRGGFDDTRGTLFFDVADIIKRKQPKAIFLENVKGLIHHDKGKTLQTILNVLRYDLDYFIPEPKIINAKDFGVPQNRERVFIVGFHKNTGINAFNYPIPLDVKVSFADVREQSVPSSKYYLSNQYLQSLRRHRDRHANKGNGFGFQIIPDNGIANAVVCGGMGRERNLVVDKRLTDFSPKTHIKGEINSEGIRRMTPREWARLQGFPDKFIIPVADSSAYRLFGNSVAIPAVQATANLVVNAIYNNIQPYIQ